MTLDRPVALVLAGRRGPGDPVAVAGGCACKAFVPVAGIPMVERVVAALEASGCLAGILVALDADAPVAAGAPGLARRLQAGTVRRVDPAGSPSASVQHAFEALPSGTPLLVATADHPLLTPEMVAAFLGEALASGADVAAALTPAAALAAAYPGSRRTRLRFRGGGYAGCNLFALMGPGARQVLAFWGAMEARRKRPWALAMRIGPRTLLAYALGRLSLEAALRRLGRKVGARLHAVILREPEAAIDVDSVADLRLVERVLTRAGGRPG